MFNVNDCLFSYFSAKVNDQSFKNISCEDLKAKYKDEKVNHHSRFNFFNKDSILNLHLKGGDVRRNKKRNKQEYDTKVLFDNVPRINTSSKKPVKNESMKQRKPNILLDDTFGFLKNNRSVTSCYRQNNNFINLDQYLLSLKKIKKRKAKKNRVPSVFGGRSRRKKKVITQCTCEHNPVKILSSLPNSTVKSAGYYNINPSNKHISEGNLGRKSNQVFKTRPVYIAPENKTAFRNQKLSKVTSTFKKKITKRNGSVTECKCPPNNYWEKQLESKRQLKKDALVSVSSLSLDPKIYCVCDAAVGTDKSKLATRKRSKTEYKCCQMKRNTPRLVAESWKQNEHPHSYNFNTIKKDRPKGLVKEEHNTFCTDFISDFVDFRVGQTKHRFSVQCMKYIFLGLLVIVWSPCLVALFLGRVIMCPQRMSCLLGGPQLLKQMQTNSNCTRNVKSKRSLNKSCRTEVPISTPINYINCLPAACINTNLPTHTSEKEFKKCQDKSLPVECQRIKMSTHSVSNKTKRKCLVTGNERPQGSSNILMNYLKNKCPISEYPRPQKLIHVKNQRQKKFMSSVASWCTRAVASFSNVVSVFKLIGFRIPSGTRASFIPSANASQRNRCSLYYSKGREWIVKPQIIQNMRCEYSPDLCLSTSSKDCILKPKCKVSFSEQQECPEDCILKHSTRKADPDSHFSTALFGNDHTSTKQQVNIEPKPLTTRFEYPTNEGALRNCKHQQIPAKRNITAPKYVVVPLHGIVVGYPGRSGYYYPKEQTNERNKKKELKNTVDKIANHIPQKWSIRPSNKIMLSKSRQDERATTNNYSFQRCLVTSKMRSNKKEGHKFNNYLANKQVNFQAKSAFDGAFKSNQIKHLVNAIKEENSHPTRTTFNKPKNTKNLHENMVYNKTGCYNGSITQLNAKPSEFLKSQEKTKSIVSFIETARVDKDPKRHPLLDKHAEHTSDSVFKKTQNFILPSAQEDTWTAYCTKASTKETVSLFKKSQKRQKPEPTADFKYDKLCSNIQSLNSFHYQQFSEGLKKCKVISNSRRYNQSKLSQYHNNKTLNYRGNLSYTEYRKQPTNLTDFDYFPKLATPIYTDPFLTNNTQNSMTHLRQQKEIPAYNSPQYFYSSHRKEYQPSQLMSVKKSISSITDTSYRKQFLPSQKVSPYDNLTFSTSYTSSLCRKSVAKGKYNCSRIYTSRSFQSILRKFKSYDEYNYDDKQTFSISVPSKPIFKQNLQLYLNLKNNTTDKLCHLPCTSISTILPRKISKHTVQLCENNSVITKNQLKISLKKRLRYLDKFFGTYNRSSRSKEMKLKCLHYSKNHNNCIACRTSYLIGKIQLLKQLLGKVGLQEKPAKTNTKKIRLDSSDRPKIKQISTHFYPDAQQKLLGISPLCKQKKLGLHPTYYPKSYTPLECTCDWFYKRLDCPSMGTQRHQCTPKCFQNLLDYLHVYRQAKTSSLSRSKRKSIQTFSNCSVICSWVNCKKNNYRQRKRHLAHQNNLMVNSNKIRKNTNMCKGGIKLNCSNCKKKKICSPKNKVEKKAMFLINNEEKTVKPSKITDPKRKKLRAVNENVTKYKRRQNRSNCPLCVHKRCSSKKKRKKNTSKCKCVALSGNKNKKRKKITKTDKIKRKESLQAKSKKSKLPKNVQKKKTIAKSKIRKTKIKSRKRTRSFPICLVDLVQTMRETEARAFPLDVDCNFLYIQSLKKIPCFWIYKLRPSLYPRFLRLFPLIKRISTFLAFCFCSPLILCSYCCFEIIVYCIIYCITYENYTLRKINIS